MDTTVRGNPIELLTIALTIVDTGRYKVHYNVDASPEAVREWLGSDVSDSAVKAVNKFVNADDPEQLAEAVQMLDLPRDAVGEAMEIADNTVKVLSNNNKQPGSFGHLYIPDIIEDAGDDGTIYMCKSVNGDKAMMAWDLNPNNIVVKVDDYEEYEVLGWEKLKNFPHGSRQIHEEFGDRLSKEVLYEVAGPPGPAGNSSGGSASRTQPSNEQLTVSTGSKRYQRLKFVASEIRDQFERAGALDDTVERLILFPTGTERNLSDNWWIAGDYGEDGAVAIANCNKSTYEYLSDLEQVMHVDTYIDNAADVEVLTTDGQKRLGDLDELIVYTLRDSAHEQFNQEVVLEHLPEVIAEECDEKWKAPDLDGDETIILLPESQAFEARPALRNIDYLISGTSDVRDIGHEYGRENENSARISATMSTYGRCRLGDWDWDSPELSAIRDSVMVGVDDGGFELIETLAQLHDEGRPLFSEMTEGGEQQ